ncbi:AP2/ERF family transcription factor [Lysinibacillus boronitolerans]|uniref:hypothetical protein n=1 Tax=Lysinibacillus boronitolerans TaxID=309788 RepID=UPI002899A6CC|nr:hypothetical protein [Bacillus mobilis]
MKPSQIEKERQLGMSMGKAAYKLQKQILFNLSNELNMNICYRCKQPITNIEEWSIDHKLDWLHSNEPNILFFDFNNIAFSHHRCNAGSAKRGNGTRKDKSQTLGVNFHTACHHLRRLVLYNLAKLSGKLQCHQCNLYIDSIESFSIEHITPWVHSENPVELYFDINNISFSHRKCNYNTIRTSSVSYSNTGFKGVTLVNEKNRKQKYRVQVYNPNTNKCIFLGRFNDIIEAARTYDRALIELYGERAVTNESLGLFVSPKYKKVHLFGTHDK